MYTQSVMDVHTLVTDFKFLAFYYLPRRKIVSIKTPTQVCLFTDVELPINVAEVQQIYNQAIKWDFGKVEQYLNNGVEKGIKKVCQEYCRFMALSIAHPGVMLPISTIVKKFWETHIIFTSNYRDFCQSLAGEYIDHDPTNTQELDYEAKKDYKLGIQMYEKCFGELNPMYWYTPSCECASCQTAEQMTN